MKLQTNVYGQDSNSNVTPKYRKFSPHESSIQIIEADPAKDPVKPQLKSELQRLHFKQMMNPI